jgi:hypothetical protein
VRLKVSQKLAPGWCRILRREKLEFEIVGNVLLERLCSVGRTFAVLGGVVGVVGGSLVDSQ